MKSVDMTIICLEKNFTCDSNVAKFKAQTKLHFVWQVQCSTAKCGVRVHLWFIVSQFVLVNAKEAISQLVQGPLSSMNSWYYYYSLLELCVHNLSEIVPGLGATQFRVGCSDRR